MLKISDIRLWVALGCSEEEKALPTCVSIDVEVTFDSIPAAVVSDSLKDTVCYASIVSSIRELCLKKRFNLIEYLAAQVYKVVEDIVQARKIIVKVTKMLPPVRDVHGGVSFTYVE